MRSIAAGFACAAAVLLSLALPGAQEPPTATLTNDPRVGLKPGLRDAGQAARHMELVSTMPKPEGFFDPKLPAGEATPHEKDPARFGSDPDAAIVAFQREQREQQPRPGGLGFANSDLAFSGNHMWIGNYHGFNTYNIENARRPRLLASIVCPGGQGDVSVYRNLLFMSVEQTRGRIDCGTGGVEAPVSTERFRGIRIFDISDMRKPKQIAAVQTCRGSHTHTLVTDPDDKANIYVYGSGTGSPRSPEELAECSALQPGDDPNTSLFSIDVIQVPLASPDKARIVNRPRIFADEKGNIAGLWQGGTHGPGTQTTSVTNQCHDITVFPEIGLAAGACSGNGILLDISDPVKPVRLDFVSDKNFAYWHSATFNNDGTKVIFTDEWGGGTRPRCRATDLMTWGANAIFDVVDRKKLRFGGYYKMPAAQGDTENCVAHNGSLIPVPGRDIMVQAWYQGGVSVFDFTDSAKAYEIAFFDRGPIDAKQLVAGGYWSAYWYNGHIYGAEIARGMDVFRLLPSEFLSQNEIDAAVQVRATEFNAQQQPRVVWPATTVVARAYLDQLTRSKAIRSERAAALKTALDEADGLRTGQERGAAGVLDRLETLAKELEADAASASGRDAERFRSLASTIKGRTTRLRP